MRRLLSSLFLLVAGCAALLSFRADLGLPISDAWIQTYMGSAQDGDFFIIAVATLIAGLIIDKQTVKHLLSFLASIVAGSFAVIAVFLWLETKWVSDVVHHVAPGAEASDFFIIAVATFFVDLLFLNSDSGKLVEPKGPAQDAPARDAKAVVVLMSATQQYLRLQHGIEVELNTLEEEVQKFIGTSEYAQSLSTIRDRMERIESLLEAASASVGDIENLEDEVSALVQQVYDELPIEEDGDTYVLTIDLDEIEEQLADAEKMVAVYKAEKRKLGSRLLGNIFDDERDEKAA